MREFLVLYDYETGGLWAVVIAPSKVAVEVAYPDLVVFDDRPAWMDDAHYQAIKNRSGFAFDRPKDYWRRFFRPSEH